MSALTGRLHVRRRIRHVRRRMGPVAPWVVAVVVLVGIVFLLTRR